MGQKSLKNRQENLIFYFPLLNFPFEAQRNKSDSNLPSTEEDFRQCMFSAPCSEFRGKFRVSPLTGLGRPSLRYIPHPGSRSIMIAALGYL